MSVFAAIRSFLTGSPKTIDDIFDKDTGHLAKIGGFIGNLHFSDQERAVLNRDMAAAVQKFAIDTLDESTERSKARRELALFVVKFYCILLFLSGITFPFNIEWSLMWFKIATDWQLGLLVTGVAGFFFGVHMMRATSKGKK